MSNGSGWRFTVSNDGEDNAGDLLMDNSFINGIRHVHFIGVGGVGVSRLASVFLSRGVRVSGSDEQENVRTRKLSTRGARIFRGHDASHIEGADLVCYSSAVAFENPEYLAARRRGVALIRRGELLAELLKGKTVYAVAGSHGKTTVTAWSACAMQMLDRPVTPMIGGMPLNVELDDCGESDSWVVETDESDGTFLHCQPDYGIVTNIDREHLNHYGSFEEICLAFATFMQGIRRGAVLCADDSQVCRLRDRISVPVITYGLGPGSMVSASDMEYGDSGVSFVVRDEGIIVGHCSISVPGEHNVRNALAVIAMLKASGIPVAETLPVMGVFKGVGRRLEIRGCYSDILFVDDYAHHPNEIKASLQALRMSHAVGRRLVVLFQPHRYTRVRDCIDDFSRCFAVADLVVVTDIYAASEAPIPGIDGLSLSERIRERATRVEYVARGMLANTVPGFLHGGDCVCAMGAGDISAVLTEVAAGFATSAGD
jgi:UDP-N-acetylmuramate--alanine ligase